MIAAINDPRIQKILTLPGTNMAEWEADLKRFEGGDKTLTRKSAGESTIKAIQRLIIFLGYSTSSAGSFSIDGDFGRGTNRAVAQFQFEQKLNPNINRRTLCYDCTWQNASKNIVAIPDTRLTVKTLTAMLGNAIQMMDANQVNCGSFAEAIFHLNGLHQSKFMSCKNILTKYGRLVDQAVLRLAGEEGVQIQPEWILSIIRQETAGVVRPRFEQHYLTRLNKKNPNADFVELRYQSMSFGLGQIMGSNFRKVGAASARAMFVSPLTEQVYFIAKYLATKDEVLGRKNPTEADFRTIARYYNGPGYESHHYHERIANWFREFRTIV